MRAVQILCRRGVAGAICADHADRAARTAGACRGSGAARWGVALSALCALLASVPAAAQPSTWYAGRAGPYVLAAAGGTQYELDCVGFYYSSFESCSYARAGAGKVALGYRFNGPFGVEGHFTDYGRGHIDNNRNPRDVIRMRALGVNAVFGLAFSPGTEGLLRVGLADVRHARSDDIGAQHVFTATVGLGLVLHLGPHGALEVGWDAVSGEGRQTGTAVAGTLTAGLRWAF